VTLLYFLMVTGTDLRYAAAMTPHSLVLHPPSPAHQPAHSPY